jgi:hypothetical protein
MPADMMQHVPPSQCVWSGQTTAAVSFSFSSRSCSKTAERLFVGRQLIARLLDTLWHILVSVSHVLSDGQQYWPPSQQIAFSYEQHLPTPFSDSQHVWPVGHWHVGFSAAPATVGFAGFLADHGSTTLPWLHRLAAMSHL